MKKHHRNYLLTSLALLAVAPFAFAGKEVNLRRIDGDKPRPDGPFFHEHFEKESVPFLGVETAPVNRTLSTQLTLPKGTGLIVIRVLEKSPASGVLKEDDVLTKLDDQVLINSPQLSVLVRSRKEGDEIRLTVIRLGKETTVKAKLVLTEMPKLADATFFQSGAPGSEAGFDRVRGLPGMGPDDAKNVMRMIQHERGNFMTGPRMRIIGRGEGRGSTIVDLPKSNISYSDEAGSIEIKGEDDKRVLTLKNPKGDVTFTGPINTEEERNRLSPEVRQRIEQLETNTMTYEVNSDFQPESIPLPPEIHPTKISFRLEHENENQPRDDASSPAL